MATNFSQFTSATTLSITDQFVGYSSASVGGERRWSYQTLRDSIVNAAEVTYSNSTTINLNWNSSTRTLNANLDDDSVTNTKLANMVTDTIKGRTTTGTGNPEDLTVAQVKTMLGLTSTGIIDLLPSNFPIQIVQTVRDTIYSFTDDGWIDIPDLSINLTRKDTSSKIRIQASIHATLRGTNSGQHNIGYRIVRGSTAIGIGDASGDRTRASAQTNLGVTYGNSHTTIDFIDTPSSSATITYKIQARLGISTHTGIINGSWSDDNAVYVFRPISTMILTELKS
jgi:hypothetical protein